MIEKFSLGIFLTRFGTPEKCLEAVLDLRFPDGVYCEKEKMVNKFYKVEGRPLYACSCGYQIAPLAGTIFEKTTTPLQYWFYAIFLMATTRSGISAKQLQRQLGVTYKTAWRMFKQIRLLMSQGGGMLGGDVEIDESFFGGKGKNRAYEWMQGLPEKEKEIVMGMVERNGKAYLKHIPNTGKWTLLKQVQDHVDTTARVMTDEYRGYWQLPKYGYKHEFINHGNKIYVKGDIHTQNVEGLWSIIKRGIYGVYRVVSPKYLQAYVDEYGWRYNHRKHGEEMFELLLKQIAEVKIIKYANSSPNYGRVL